MKLYMNYSVGDLSLSPSRNWGAEDALSLRFYHVVSYATFPPWNECGRGAHAGAKKGYYSLGIEKVAMFSGTASDYNFIYFLLN
jgi:hypothetical protein